MPHRIAYVIGGLGKGGAEYQLYELARHLDRRAYDPCVFLLSSAGDWVSRIRAEGMPVVPIPRRGSADLARLLRLRSALRDFRPDVLHTILWPGNSYGRMAAIGLGIPVVIAAERNVIRRPSWQVAIERGLDRMTDAYLVNSDAIVAELTDHGGLPREKIIVIRNGIDLEGLPPFDPDRRKTRAHLGFAPERRLVAQVGRLTDQKDYPTYLAAMADVAATVLDVDFLIVGEGPARTALEAEVVRRGLGERIHFTGLRNDVPLLLGGVDVLCLTSVHEGLPNVVIEAMAMGAVVVATDVGGVRELVTTGETGFVVPARAPGAVAGAVCRLLADPEGARRMAEAARVQVERNSVVQVTAARTMDVYHRLLDLRERTIAA